MSTTAPVSTVEQAFLAASGHSCLQYQGEHTPVLEVKNVYELGKIVSQRFLEWVRENPSGVVALPTGKTPEFFIKTLERYRQTWDSPATQSELSVSGVAGSFPDTSGLRFVMLDEFYPMSSQHRNSFCRYIHTFYLPLLGIQPENILTFDVLKEGVLTEAELTFFEGKDMDVTLLHREPTSDEEKDVKHALQKAAAFCEVYERKIADWGGVGFFLGGIGPDGHIAFNQEGSDLHSRTRLVNFNYPTAAQAAGDLGGISNARGKAAFTIGLDTITAKQDATIIIMAAGEGKAKVVRSAIEDAVHPNRPASELQLHKGARFYLTEGAAFCLTARKAKRLSEADENICMQFAVNHLAGLDTRGGEEGAYKKSPVDYKRVEEFLYELSLRFKCPVHELSVAHLLKLSSDKSVQDGGRSSPDSATAALSSAHTPTRQSRRTTEKSVLECITYSFPAFLAQESNLRVLVACAVRRLREKVEAGLRAHDMTNSSILHTEPHHDDIMLSYHGAMHGMFGRVEAAEEQKHLGETVGGNKNYFACLTSGFHSVDDRYIGKLCKDILEAGKIESIVSSGDLLIDYDLIMRSFRYAFNSRDFGKQDALELVIFLRKIAEVWTLDCSIPSISEDLRRKVLWVQDDFLSHHRPGDAIPKDMQLLKGCMRESEADRVWALSNMPMERVSHLRSKFYTDDFFTPMPSIEEDTQPMADLLILRKPDMLSVAFDPEGTGPDTHYKVLLVVAAGLRLAMSSGKVREDMMVWGYRNVWFEFLPSDATIMMPVSKADLQLMHDTFMACFTTQKTAQFPSPSYDGPFSAWAIEIQEKQRRLLGQLLGEEYMCTHIDERVRNSEGFVFVNAMYAKEFLSEVRDLSSKLQSK